MGQTEWNHDGLPTTPSLFGTALRSRIQRTALGSLYYCALIGQEPVQALIDEGAKVSLIKPNIYYQIPYSQRPPLQSADVMAQGVATDQLHILGQIHVPVTINAHAVDHTFVLVEELHRSNIDCMIGNDITADHNLYLYVCT